MRYLEDSNRIAIISGDQRYTYHQLISRTLAYAQKSKSATKECVCILAENRPEWIFSFYSAWHNHQIPVPLDIMATPSEIAFILDDCEPVAVWCSEKGAELLSEALTLTTKAKPAIYRMDQVEAPAESDEPLDFGENMDDETGVIVYTSGTTGSPKGVVLSFKNMYSNLYAVSKGVPIYQPDDRILILLPLQHVLPLQGTMVMPLTIGATCVFAPSLKAEDIIGAMHDNQVTMMIGVPRLYILFRDAMLKKIQASFIARCLFRLCSWVNSLGFSRLIFRQAQQRFGGHIRYFPCGGAAMDPQVVKDFRTLGFEILCGYGMTETAPMMSFTHPGRPRSGSAGQVIPCNEIKIQDGEITVRGDNVMKEYYRRPEDTAQVFDAEGWLHTGDLGYVDKDGYIFITGRKKEIIVLSNGKNINPDEIETHIMNDFAQGLLKECAITPSGDSLLAILMPDMQAIQRQRIVNIEETLRDRIIEPYNLKSSSYKRILKCSLSAEPLPRTRLGKLRRHELAALVTADTKHKLADAAPAPDTREYKVIADYLHNQTGMDILPDDHLELDLSLDSLAKVSFLSFLTGTFGQTLPESLLVDYPTPRKLSEYLKENAVEGHEIQETVVQWSEVLREEIDIKLPKCGWSHRWLNTFSAFLLHCISRMKGKGAHHLPKAPFIFAPNHQSYLDVLYLMAYLDADTLENTYFYATSKHVESKIAKYVARKHNVIVMDLNGNIKASLQTLAAALKAGHNVVIFPEGTRSLDGELGVLKQSFAILARELNVPVVPVAIDGAHRVLPRGCRFIRPFRKVKVTFLPAVVPTTDDTYATIVAKVTAALKEKLQ